MTFRKCLWRCLSYLQCRTKQLFFEEGIYLFCEMRWKFAFLFILYLLIISRIQCFRLTDWPSDLLWNADVIDLQPYLISLNLHNRWRRNHVFWTQTNLDKICGLLEGDTWQMTIWPARMCIPLYGVGIHFVAAQKYSLKEGVSPYNFCCNNIQRWAFAMVKWITGTKYCLQCCIQFNVHFETRRCNWGEQCVKMITVILILPYSTGIGMNVFLTKDSVTACLV